MSVKVTQVYSCDICNKELETFEHTVPHGSVAAVINHAGVEHLTVRSGYGFSRTHDICTDCWGQFCDWTRAALGDTQ